MARIARERAIMLDRGGQRLTRMASGETCLRDEWMVGPEGGRAWADKVAAFHARNPGCTVVDEAREPADDLSRWPMCGGGHEVGDVLVTRGREGTMSAREIVARQHLPDVEWREPASPDHGFLLEDGTVLRWTGSHNGWFCHDPETRDMRRARPPLPGEPVDEWRPTAHALASRALDIVVAALDRVDADWGDPPAGRPVPEDMVMLSMHRAALRADRLALSDRPGYLRVARDSLDDASGWLLRQVQAGHVAGAPWPDGRCEAAARVGSTVAETLARRLGPVTAPGGP